MTSAPWMSTGGSTGGRSLLSWPLRLRHAYHGDVSSQDGGGRPDYPPSSDEAAEGPDILEQGRDRPATRWRPTVRWRQPPAVAIILGITGVLVGLAAGYAAGTLHAEKATAPSAQSRATASSTPTSPILIGGAPGQFHLLHCSAGGATCTFRRLDTPVTNLSTTAANGTVIVILPPAGGSN
jgi:xanthosine utilization system XapX-like protein